MNNPCTSNPGTDNCIPQSLSTAHIRPHVYKAQGLQPHNRPLRVDQQGNSLTENPDEPVAHLSYAVGGSLSSLSIEDHRSRGQLYPRIDRSRGIRRKISGFSKTSRRNLLRHLASINRRAFRRFKGRLISVTLTYPHEYPEDPQLCKEHLKAFQKRLRRKYGEFSAFWRMGIQKRGAFHFHLLLFVPPSFGRIDALHSFISCAWYEVCGKVSEGHLRAGTRVEVVRSWKQATSYAERYLAKEEEFPEGLETGRIWGIWNEKFLPIQWETVKVSLQDAYKIRRVFRKLAKRRGSGSLRRLTVFIMHETVLRLLQFLGYRLE